MKTKRQTATLVHNTSDVLLPIAVAINTNELLSGPSITSRPIFNYAQQHEFDGCWFDLSAALTATTLVTAIVLKTDKIFFG